MKMNTYKPLLLAFVAFANMCSMEKESHTKETILPITVKKLTKLASTVVSDNLERYSTSELKNLPAEIKKQILFPFVKKSMELESYKQIPVDFEIHDRCPISYTKWAVVDKNKNLKIIARNFDDKEFTLLPCSSEVKAERIWALDTGKIATWMKKDGKGHASIVDQEGIVEKTWEVGPAIREEGFIVPGVLAFCSQEKATPTFFNYNNGKVSHFSSITYDFCLNVVSINTQLVAIVIDGMCYSYNVVTQEKKQHSDGIFYVAPTFQNETIFCEISFHGGNEMPEGYFTINDAGNRVAINDSQEVPELKKCEKFYLNPLIGEGFSSAIEQAKKTSKNLQLLHNRQEEKLGEVKNSIIKRVLLTEEDFYGEQLIVTSYMNDHAIVHSNLDHVFMLKNLKDEQLNALLTSYRNEQPETTLTKNCTIL